MLNNGQKKKLILLNGKATILLKAFRSADSFNPRKEEKRSGTNWGHFYFPPQIPEGSMELLSNIK